MAFSLIGIGSPLVDYTAAVSDIFLKQHISGLKGGTEHINYADRARIINAVGKNILRTPGGAAANTVCALGRLGVETAFMGKLGDDDDGRFFCNELAASGVSTEVLCKVPGVTGCCISLVTPDAERTMCSDLGVSVQITKADIEKTDFSKYSWLLSEGYMLQIPGFEQIFSLAHQSGCCTALDLSSVEIARKKQKELTALIADDIDLVLCNSDEAAALTGNVSAEKNLEFLSTLAETAVIKLGKEGSLIKSRGGTAIKIPPHDFGAAVDTTAAGDHYAAGLFYGIARGCSWEKCGFYGSILGGAAAASAGSRITEELWQQITEFIDQQ